VALDDVSVSGMTSLRRALITGATSFVGSRLARRLVKSGWRVNALVRSGSDLSKLGEARARVVAHAWDGTQKSVSAAVGACSPTDVFHLAVAGGIEHAIADVAATVEANVLLGALLLESLPGAATGAEPRDGLVRFVNAGSYWQFAEDGTVAPVSLHAATKEAFASILQWYQASGRVRSLTLVLHDVHGPADPRGKLIDRLVGALASGEPLDVTPGHQRLDFVHVDDVVEAFVHAADLLAEGSLASGSNRSGVEGRRFAVRTGRLHSIRELVALLERMGGRKVPVNWGARPYPPRQLMRPWEGPVLPGWTPRVSLEDGLRELLQASG
jgi:nucleoside-diphosphate-sugar epimerase